MVIYKYTHVKEDVCLYMYCDKSKFVKGLKFNTSWVIKTISIGLLTIGSKSSSYQITVLYIWVIPTLKSLGKVWVTSKLRSIISLFVLLKMSTFEILLRNFFTVFHFYSIFSVLNSEWNEECYFSFTLM